VIERDGQAAPVALQNATQTRRDDTMFRPYLLNPSLGRLTPSANHAILQPIRKKDIFHALE
jgi:hypothetical protein